MSPASPSTQARPEDLSAERQKFQKELDREAWLNWVYPPEFWDELHDCSLSRKALQEIDRRTEVHRSKVTFPPQPYYPIPEHILRNPPKCLSQFSEYGGPDLTDIKGVSYDY